MNKEQKIKKFEKILPIYCQAYAVANGSPFIGEITFKNGWVQFNKRRISLTIFEEMKNRLLDRAKNPVVELRQITIGDIGQLSFAIQSKLSFVKLDTPMEEFANEQVKILTETFDVKESQAMFLVMMAINQYFTPKPSSSIYLR